MPSQSCGCCISHQFSAAASETPAKIAIVKSNSNFSDRNSARISSSPPVYYGDEYFTYANVLSAVDSFSRRVRSVLDGGDDPDLVRPKDDSNGVSSFPRMVGVHSVPSVEYIIAVLSVLRCGEAFLPLDPYWPEERKLSIISSSRTSLIITTGGASRSDIFDWIVDRIGCSVLPLSVKAGLMDYFARSDMEWPCQSISPRKFCYLMYTSGSMGRPKGVCGTETGLLNRFWWMQAQFPVSKDDIILFKTSTSFVDHLQEFLSAILARATLIVPPHDELKANPSCIVKLAEAYGVSRLTCVPTLIRTIILSGTSQLMAICKSLKLLVLSGEILSLSLWKALDGLLPETTILNLYGSTEVRI